MSITGVAKWFVPTSARPRVKAGLRRLQSFGTSRYCPICRSHVNKFLPHGKPLRPEAVCPVCKSRERHRLIWHYFEQQTDLFRGAAATFLHFAPEPALASRMRRLKNVRYCSVDIKPADVDAGADILRLPFADQTFDWIYASHVINCVVDDLSAMRELRRVLKPRGTVILQASIYDREETVEHERTPDCCVRRYGRDFTRRISSAGFAVTESRLAEQMNAADVARMGLGDPNREQRQNDLYLCRKSV